MQKRDRLYDAMNDLGACSDALKWIQDLDDNVNLVVAWDECPNSDWLQWLLAAWHIDQGLFWKRYVDSGWREEIRYDYRDTIACIAYYTGL